jgi:AcrR family transcriptional regulator
VSAPPAEAPRRREILEATIAIVVERGFEGLRLRDVADAVGINSATLVYHVRGKEALIVEVVGEIIARFRALNAERGLDLDSPSGLGVHLASIRDNMIAAPALFVVLAEVAMRARRHAAIGAALEEALASWTWVFRRLFAAAAPGASAADIATWSQATIAFFWGLNLRSNADGTFAALLRAGDGAGRAAAALRSAVEGYEALVRRDLAARSPASP